MDDPGLVALLAVAAVTGAATFVYAMRRMTRPTDRGAQYVASARPLPPVTLDDATRAQIDELLRLRQPIRAIKLVRERTGLGLADAKAVVDRWNEADAPVPDLDALVAETRAVALDRGDVAAVKLVRERTGWGLLEAKRFVDQIDRP